MVLLSRPQPLQELNCCTAWMQTQRQVAAKLRPSQMTWDTSQPLCYHSHPPSPFVIITQPEGWYSFYHPTEGRRLSHSRHCTAHIQGCTSQLYKQNWQQWALILGFLTLQSHMLLPDHWDLICDSMQTASKMNITSTLFLTWSLASTAISHVNTYTQNPFSCKMSKADRCKIWLSIYD